VPSEAFCKVTSTSTQSSPRRTHRGPANSSDVSDPSGSAHVVEDSLRSDSASTRSPVALAATRAAGTSAACLAGRAFVADGAACPGAAGAATATSPSARESTRATGSTSAGNRHHRPGRERPGAGPENRALPGPDGTRAGSNRRQQDIEDPRDG